jgi:iron(III) transport system substrate-binding protein
MVRNNAKPLACLRSPLVAPHAARSRKVPTLSRQKFFGAFAAAGLSLLISACGQGPAPTADTGTPATAPSTSVNVYSARHYDSDEAMYAAFTAKTGIKVNRIEASADLLLERLKAEGAASPADVVIVSDAGALWRLADAGVLGEMAIPAAEALAPAHFRDPQKRWYGLTKRARVIAYDRTRFTAEQAPQSYAALADPVWQGEVCARASSNIYNLSLMSALIGRWGEDEAERWARGVVANFARQPSGGDTDQLKAVAAGECGVALVNQYYWVRLAQSANPDDRAVADRIGLVYPDQDGPGQAGPNQVGAGTHVNVTGAGVAAHAPHPDAAAALISYLASTEGQRYLTQETFEAPFDLAAMPDAPGLVPFLTIKEDPVDLAALGERQGDAQRLFDLAEWR